MSEGPGQRSFLVFLRAFSGLRGVSGGGWGGFGAWERLGGGAGRLPDLDDGQVDSAARPA